MDIYLIKDGIVDNIASFESLEQAIELRPDMICIVRDETNAHFNPGDIYQ